MRWVVCAWWLVLGHVFAACAIDRGFSEVQPTPCRHDCDPQPIGPLNRDVDILFVIDNSPAMLAKQTSLKNNFPNFINVLGSVPGGLPNLHIGVVTTDLGTKGAADPQPGPAIGMGPGACSGTGQNGNLVTNGSAMLTGTFISDIQTGDGSRTTNYAGSLASVFSSLASVGANGCGFEQPLEAAKRALNNNPANAGFMRPDALLALVFVQDEDDCSFAHSSLLDIDTTTLGPLQSFRCNRFGHVCTQGGTTPDLMNVTGPKGGCASNESSPYLTRVGDYVTFFKGLKTNPANVIVAGIAGPTLPYEVELRVPNGSTTAIPAVAHSCSYVAGTAVEVADPAVRLRQFLAQFPNRNTVTTVCNEDLSGALILIAELVKQVVGTNCVEVDDIDPAPGFQVDCVVAEVQNYGHVNQTERVLLQCDNLADPPASTIKPCWWLKEDATACPVASQRLLQIERSEPPPEGTQILAYCARFS
ncbi:MAG TPA: hypothetical protein VIV11_12255 [Kofleriaceae bacterium]